MIVRRTEMQIVQNLKDAGCPDDFIQTFMETLAQGKTADGVKLLQKHRRFLLNSTHAWQKRIDCLDYLLYQIKEQKKTNFISQEER